MKRYLHRADLRKKWVFPMIVGVLLIMLPMLFVNGKAIDMMTSDKIRESEKVIETVGRSVDHYLFALRESGAQLMLNSRNISLQSAESKGDFTEAPAYRFSELMCNIKTANALVEEIYIYYPKYDYVIGTEGSYLSKNYFILDNQLSIKGYDAWMKDILGAKQTDFFFAEGHNGEKQLYLRQQMPTNKEAEPQCVLIISVNGAEFMRLLDMTLPYDGSTVIAVFDNEDELYQTGTEEELPEQDKIRPLFERAGNEMQKIENSAYVGWRRPSEYNSFYYVVLSDKTALLGPILSIQRLLVAGIILCTIAGLSVSICLGRRHHRTIEETINGLNEQVLWSMKENILADILNRRQTDANAITELLQSGGVALDYVHYRFVLADVSFAKNKKKLQEWIFETGKRLEHEESAVDVVPALLGNNAVFLLNYDTSAIELADRLEGLFREICAAEVPMKQSEVFLSVEQIVPVYEQVLLLFREQLGIGGITELSKEKEGRLCLERWQKALSIRKYANASEMIPELYHTYIAIASDAYIRLSRQYYVSDRVLQCVEMEDERYHTNLYPLVLGRVKNSMNTHEMPELLADVLNHLEQVNQQYSMKQKDKLAVKIRMIIEENFTQPYLGLNYISEQVNVSTSYVSKVFKDEYGIGVVEYMNRMRIDKAKQIMEKERFTVKEIAEMVGFTSDIHFIRSFKKYENITPGVWKKQSH